MVLLDRTVTTIGLHLKKKPSKLVNFCAAILTLKMEKKCSIFGSIMLYYFKKGKNETETQRKIRAVDGEGAVTD